MVKFYRYAVSPIPPSGKELSARIPGKIARSVWEIEVPYDGFYGIQGTFSGKRGKITLTGASVKNRKFEYDLQPSNVDVPQLHLTSYKKN